MGWKISIIKMAVTTWWSTDSIQSKFKLDFFAEIDKLFLKLMWKLKELRIAKTFLGKTHIPYFKTYYKATVIKTVCYQLHKDKRWNKI